jgi:hypothetical protein
MQIDLPDNYRLTRLSSSHIVSPHVSDDASTMADLFRRKRTNDSVDPDQILNEFALRTGGEHFIIDPFPKSMRRVPSLDYLESAGGQTSSSSEITEIPRQLNAKLKTLQYKELQQTAIETGEVWMQRNVMSKNTMKEIGKSEQEINTKKAMDLLYALSRSGSLPIQFSGLHAMVGVTHCFAQNLMDTLVLDNVDPIKQLSDSTLFLASVIHDTPLDSLTKKNS